MPVPPRRLLLLLAHREGQAVPDLLPQGRQPRGARGGDARPQRAGRGASLPRPRRRRGERRRPPPRLYDRHHRLPRVHALREGSRARARCCPTASRRCASVAWAADDATLFYVTEDEAKRPYRLLPPPPGRRGGRPRCYEEPDALFRLDVGRSRSRAYLFLVSGSFTTTEVRYLAAGDPAAAWRMLLPREQDHEYQVDHGVGPDGDVFYIRTNGGGRRNFRLVTAPGGRSASRALDRADPAPRRRDARGRGRLRPALRRPRARGRADPAARHRRCADGAHAPRRVPRADLRREPGRQRGVRRRRRTASATSRWSRPPRCSTTTSRARRAAPAQADGGAGRLRPDALPLRAHPRDGRRRHPRAHLARLPRRRRRATARARCCSRATAPTAIPYPVDVLVEPAEPARPRRHRGHRPHPRRRRAGQALARRRPHDEQAQHLHRLHRRRRAPGQGAATPRADRLVIEGGSAGGLLMGAVLNLRPDLLPRRGAARALRGRDQHHARRVAAAHGGRVRGVGQPEDPRAVRVHEELLPVHQPGRAAVSGACSSRPRSTTAR